MIKRSTIKWLGDKPEVNYTIIPNSLIRDKALSSDAVRVAAYLWSLKSGYEVSMRSIATALGMPKNSNRVGKALHMLIGRGWLKLTKYTDDNGHLYKCEYVGNRARPIFVVDSTTDTAYESTTRYNNQKQKENPWRDGWSAPGAAQGAASGQSPEGGVAELVGHRETLESRCPECGCREHDPWDRHLDGCPRESAYGF